MLPVGIEHQYCDTQSWVLSWRPTGVQWGAQRAVGWEMKGGKSQYLQSPAGCRVKEQLSSIFQNAELIREASLEHPP